MEFSSLSIFKPGCISCRAQRSLERVILFDKVLAPDKHLLASLDFMAVFNKISGVHKVLPRSAEMISVYI